MAKYESKIKQINAPVANVYAMLSNLENLRPMLENARNSEVVREKIREAGQDPAQLDRLKDVTLTPDRISFPAPMVGEVALAVVEREENKCIKFQTEQSPVPFYVWIQMLPVTETTSKMKVTAEADLNPFVKAMVQKPLQQGVEQIAEGLSRIQYT